MQEYVVYLDPIENHTTKGYDAKMLSPVSSMEVFLPWRYANFFFIVSPFVLFYVNLNVIEAMFAK